jgi:non-ribosomal peptide synthetase component F
MSVKQIFLGLLNGHRLIVTKDKSWMDSSGLIELMKREKVTYVCSTPSLLRQLNLEEVQTLKVVNAGG